MNKKFIESLGWKHVRCEMGYVYDEKSHNYRKAEFLVYKLEGKFIRHTEASKICLFFGNGNRLNPKQFDKTQLVDYTNSLKKKIKIEAAPSLYTAKDYIDATNKIAELTK